MPAPNPVPRFFLAHSKNITDEALDDLVKRASTVLDSLAEGRAFDLVLARTYWEERFKACGSWDAWTSEVATGTDYLSRSPLFRAIILPVEKIGAATAKIVERSLAVHKPVIGLLSGTGSGMGLVCCKITAVVCDDPKDWKTGWSLRGTPVGGVE